MRFAKQRTSPFSLKVIGSFFLDNNVNSSTNRFNSNKSNNNNDENNDNDTSKNDDDTSKNDDDTSNNDDTSCGNGGYDRVGTDLRKYQKIFHLDVFG